MDKHIFIYFIYACIYLSIKSQKSGMAEKGIAYLRVLNIFHYINAINMPSFVNLDV